MGKSEIAMKGIREKSKGPLKLATRRRYQDLRLHWAEVAAGTKVLCRCRTQKPEDFLKCGHGRPLSCGRVSLDPVHDQWSPALGTKEWRCTTCDYNDTNDTPAGSTSDNVSYVRARGVAKQNKRARAVMSVT